MAEINGKTVKFKEAKNYFVVTKVYHEGGYEGTFPDKQGNLKILYVQIFPKVDVKFHIGDEIPGVFIKQLKDKGAADFSLNKLPFLTAKEGEVHPPTRVPFQGKPDNNMLDVSDNLPKYPHMPYNHFYSPEELSAERSEFKGPQTPVITKDPFNDELIIRIVCRSRKIDNLVHNLAGYLAVGFYADNYIEPTARKALGFRPPPVRKTSNVKLMLWSKWKDLTNGSIIRFPLATSHFADGKWSDERKRWYRPQDVEAYKQKLEEFESYNIYAIRDGGFSQKYWEKLKSAALPSIRAKGKEEEDEEEKKPSNKTGVHRYHNLRHRNYGEDSALNEKITKPLKIVFERIVPNSFDRDNATVRVFGYYEDKDKGTVSVVVNVPIGIIYDLDNGQDTVKWQEDEEYTIDESWISSRSIDYKPKDDKYFSLRDVDPIKGFDKLESPTSLTVSVLDIYKVPTGNDVTYTLYVEKDGKQYIALDVPIDDVPDDIKIGDSLEINKEYLQLDNFALRQRLHKETAEDKAFTRDFDRDTGEAFDYNKDEKEFYYSPISRKDLIDDKDFDPSSIFSGLIYEAQTDLFEPCEMLG